MLLTLFRDSSLYFWNLQSFEADYKLSSLDSGLNLTCFDYSPSMEHIVMGGRGEYFTVLETADFFNGGDMIKKYYKLPEGFVGIKKVQFLRDSKRVAILTNGSLIVVKIDGDRLMTDFSIKLPSRSIVDFDIDLNCYYCMVVSSEGDVCIYETAKAQEAE